MPQLPAFSALRASNSTRRQAALFLGAPRLKTNAAATTARFLGASARASKPTPQLPTFETIALVLLGAARLVSNATRNVPKTDKDRGAARFLGASHLETKAAANFYGRPLSRCFAPQNQRRNCPHSRRSAPRIQRGR